MSQRLTNRYLVLCVLSLPTAATQVFAALPPKYLEVKDFDRCLADKDMGSYHAWCLPAEKPIECPKDAWQQLNKLTGPDKVPAC